MSNNGLSQTMAVDSSDYKINSLWTYRAKRELYTSSYQFSVSIPKFPGCESYLVLLSLIDVSIVQPQNGGKK